MRLKFLIVLLLIAIALGISLSACKKNIRTQLLKTIVVVEDLPVECGVFSAAKPMFLDPQQDKAYFEKVLGFWFPESTGKFLADVDLAISNIFSTANQSVAITNLAIHYTKEATAQEAESYLSQRYSASNLLFLHRTGSYLAILGVDKSLSRACVEAYWSVMTERMKKLENQ